MLRNPKEDLDALLRYINADDASKKEEGISTCSWYIKDHTDLLVQLRDDLDVPANIRKEFADAIEDDDSRSDDLSAKALSTLLLYRL